MPDTKRRAWLFLGLSLLLAAVAGYLFLQKVHAVNQTLGEKVKIYIAKKNIASYELLREEDFQGIEIPKQFVKGSAVIDLYAIQIDQNTYPLHRLVSVVPMTQGELLTSHVLKPKGDVMSKEKRLVSLSRSERIGFDAPIDFHDQVDIVVSGKIGNSEPKTMVLMRNVPVKGIVKDEKGNVVAVGLEMTLPEAERLIHEQNFAISIRVLKVPDF
ncbi:hypothetical protein [Thermoflavimicrobium dichotomicum]|uniref:Pilus assembly protein CpaB n=1 Tax=Thermoflavimicrobium dichotomicum TaxID=46223 RepID=A0A1I3QT53_9BACL|nr:hypothetical protein [Thermoflavimicrobium dichotomicum]SFJ36441.1 pilus assembly protein CpaB [Thermoflavimicrobium dichotomicum]